MIKRRNQFEQALTDDLAAKEDRMNTAEIRSEHYMKLANIQYDKGALNDRISFAFLSDRKNYNPLNLRFRLIPRPAYSKDGDWNKTPVKTYLKRLLLGVILLKVGLAMGEYESKNIKLENQTVVDFESEDQIFDYLYNQNKRAVFLYLFTPGHLINEHFMKVFEQESSVYSEKPNPQDSIVFMKVLCRKNLNFCTNKMWPGRILPSAEVYFINEEDKIELVDFGERHRSAAGIESFFVQQGLLEDRLDPSALLERAGRKYLEII